MVEETGRWVPRSRQLRENSQCRFCGLVYGVAKDGACPLAKCRACGTRQCFDGNTRTCSVCSYGILDAGFAPPPCSQPGCRYPADATVLGLGPICIRCAEATRAPGLRGAQGWSVKTVIDTIWSQAINRWLLLNDDGKPRYVEL